MNQKAKEKTESDEKKKKKTELNTTKELILIERIGYVVLGEFKGPLVFFFHLFQTTEQIIIWNWECKKEKKKNMLIHRRMKLLQLSVFYFSIFRYQNGWIGPFALMWWHDDGKRNE